MFPSAIASTSSSRPISVPPAIGSINSFASTFTRASATIPMDIVSSSSQLGALCKMIPATLGKYLSAKQWCNVSRTSKGIHDSVFNHILPIKLLGKHTKTYRETAGPACDVFMSTMAKLPYTSFQNTPINAMDQPYEETQHGSLNSIPLSSMHRESGASISRWGRTMMQHVENTIQITKNQITSVTTLNTLDRQTHLWRVLSPNGLTCAARIGSEEVHLHIWRIDEAGNVRGGNIPVLIVDDASASIEATDSGIVFLLSKKEHGKDALLHCCRANGAVRSIALDFDNPHLTASSPDGRYVVLDNVIDQNIQTVLVDLMPENSDANAPYRFYELEVLSRPLSGRSLSSCCFSPDSNILAFIPFTSENQNAAPAVDRVFFINIAAACSATAPGTAIDVSNPIVSRWAIHPSIRRGDSGTRLGYLPDGLTLVRYERDSFSEECWVRKIHFPYMSRESAIKIAAQKTSLQSALQKNQTALVQTTPKSAQANLHPMVLNTTKKHLIRLGILPGEPIVNAMEKRGFTWRTRPPLLQIAYAIREPGINPIAAQRIAEEITTIERLVAVVSPPLQNLAGLISPINKITAISKDADLQKIKAAAIAAKKIIIKGEREIAEVTASMAFLRQPRLPFAPPDAKQQNIIDHLQEISQRHARASQIKREERNHSFAMLAAISVASNHAASAKKSRSETAYEQDKEHARRQSQYEKKGRSVIAQQLFVPLALLPALHQKPSSAAGSQAQADAQNARHDAPMEQDREYAGTSHEPVAATSAIPVAHAGNPSTQYRIDKAEVDRQANQLMAQLQEEVAMAYDLHLTQALQALPAIPTTPLPSSAENTQTSRRERANRHRY